MSATPSPSPPLPPPMPPPRAVRRLTMDNQQTDSPPPRSPSPERAAIPVVEHRPSSTAPSTGWRSTTSGRTRHSPGTTRQAAGSATSRRRTSLTGRRLTQRRPPPRARINSSRTRTSSTAVRASAAGDRRRLRASRTWSFVCTRTTRAGSRCVTKPQDSKRAAHTTATRASTCETYHGHAE